VQTNVIFMIKIFMLALLMPQPPATFPAQLDRGQGTPASIYPNYALVVWEGARTADIVRMNEVIDSMHLVKVQPKDTSRNFTSHPKGAWLEKGNGPNLTAHFWSSLQARLPAKIFVSPAYVVGTPRRDRAFAPVPNVLIVTQDNVTNALKSQLSLHGFRFDSARSKYLTGKVVYRSERENAILARQKILTSLS
jgi:hypothetical protein